MPKRESSRGDDTVLDAGERSAGTRMESDIQRYNKEKARGSRTGEKKAEGDVAKHALTEGDKLTKGRPTRHRR